MEIAEWLFFGAAFFSGLVLLYFVIGRGDAEAHPVERPVSDKKEKLPCILCGSRLYRGETVSSKIIKTEGDTIVHVYGCHHCSGVHGDALKKCPVCDTVLKNDEYVMGRMWDRPGGRQHLHILGCTGCRYSRRGTRMDT